MNWAFAPLRRAEAKSSQTLRTYKKKFAKKISRFKQLKPDDEIYINKLFAQESKTTDCAGGSFNKVETQTDGIVQSLSFNWSQVTVDVQRLQNVGFHQPSENQNNKK